MKLDIKKAFDSANNIFLIKALDKYGFKEDFYEKDTNSNTKSKFLDY